MFSDRPLRTTESNVRFSGGPGSVSTGTQASSGKSRTVSADARVPFTMFSISFYDDIRTKEASQKEEFANSLYLSNTF